MVLEALSNSSRWIALLPPFARRALQANQMEFDSALSQMYSLCVRPSLVSRISRARKMTKNRYHRDDPAFLVLQILFIAITSIAYGLTFRCSFFRIVYMIITNVLVNYLLFGCVCASVEWVIVNRFLTSATHEDENNREIDWQYSFDIHCNGYFTYFIWTRVVPFLFLLLLRSNSLLACFVANSWCLIGCVAYVYNVFLGYLELPMVGQQQKLLYPIPFLIGFFLLLTLSGTNWLMSRLEAEMDR